MSVQPRRVHRALVGLLTAIVVVTMATAAAPTTETLPTRAVIVQAENVDAAAALVRAVGGDVTARYDTIGAVATRLDATAVAVLERGGNVVVTPDVALEPTDAEFPADTHSAAFDAISPGPAAAVDAGAGVAVALIDTGVNPTADLHAPRLVTGPDLSGDGDAVDRFGHGTFMAGLIAGDGTASADAAVHHRGVAPGARVVAVKVAGASGETELSTVLDAFEWVIEHSEELDIRVLSLSFGIPVPLPPVVNPLDAAAEAAWASGITVVAAAGNEGRAGVVAPGDDPWVVTVGASDVRGTADVSDDVVPDWSGRERVLGVDKPELVAPGVSVVSLRAPGSTIDVANPDARVDDAYFRGSGSSMATAMTAGAAAVLAAEHPGATPDHVKGALVDGATPIGGGRALNVHGAHAATPRRAWLQRHPNAIGLPGNRMPWAAEPWSAARWTDESWNAARWTAARWTAARWTDESWNAARWTAARWTAARWTDESWNAARWTAARWTAARWTASRWTSVTWASP
ncbi:MAG TPA: S8 family serine peptidase [Acidimicrobiia bacterium]|nr:S8 family serine peptidase [Acidimicrobiia bacterium]